jgi:hypothetical protein
MTLPAVRLGPPTVRLVGRVDHPEFQGAIALLRRDAVVCSTEQPPELIILAQERPGAIGQQQVEELRRAAPLAGIVVIVGSWCEGELRTGRPLAGVTRLYWYEFPVWWRRQVERRGRGLCPEWSSRADFGFRNADCGLKERQLDYGLVVVSTPWWELFDAISDELKTAGYPTLWQKPGRPFVTARGVMAGVWEGGQLNEREADCLAAFCSRLADEGAPVVALLDFPRRECADQAISAGAAAVLGKPWMNEDLLNTIDHAIQIRNSHPGKLPRAHVA